MIDLLFDFYFINDLKGKKKKNIHLYRLIHKIILWIVLMREIKNDIIAQN